MMVYTRKDYMTDKCTHAEYYGQLVTQGMKDHIARAIPQGLARSTDPAFNDIPLATWDRIGSAYRGLGPEFKKLGDFMSKAGLVCVLKEAARQVKEGCPVCGVPREPGDAPHHGFRCDCWQR